MGLIWLKYPVLWHSSRVPSGYDYSQMTVDQAALIRTRFRDWYTSDWDYAQTTVEFLCAGIAILAIFNVYWRLNGSSTSLSRPTAFARYFTAKQYRVTKLNWYSPSLGVIVSIAGFFVFFGALLLGTRPYYWPNDAMGHSPPIATRSGWISVAIMPFMIAFATKVNWVTLFVGTSHEKLQVYHRWTALIMYITSLVHTFPFIVNSIRLGEMESQWSGSPWYWTGVAALIPQTYLVGLSWEIFRNRYYEVFKKLHFIAAGIFMAALFIHCNFRLTSWDYFWATLGLYGSAWFIRVAKTIYNSGPFGLPAHVELITPELVRLTIEAPKRLNWSPGQHVFIRVMGLGINFLSSHPFTVASISSDKNENGTRKLELVFRVRDGITRTFAGYSQGKVGKGLRVLVDGPYGGLGGVVLGKFDRVCVLSGGSGSTFALPIISDLLNGLGDASTEIEYIVAVRKRDVAWIFENMEAIPSHPRLVRKVYLTSEDDAQSSDSASGKDFSSDVKLPSEEGRIESLRGRPHLRTIVHQACTGHRGSTALIACGPSEFLYDIRNAVATYQLAVTDGFGISKNVYLHTENYSW